MPLRLRQFLVGLLAILKEDYPRQLDGIVKEAKGLVYLQVLDKDKAVVKVRDGRITIAGLARKSETNVRVYTSRDCLFDILEGRVSLDEAVRSDDLRVFGDPLMILSCYRMWERVISLARASPRLYFLAYDLRDAPRSRGSARGSDRVRQVAPHHASAVAQERI
jgi:hypothetical protein